MWSSRDRSGKIREENVEIKVKQIKKSLVSFSSKYGNAVGIWKDDDAPTLKKYDVELTINDVIECALIQEINAIESKLELCGEKIHIVALLSDYDGGGCATLRMGESIVEVETQYDEKFYSLCGNYISFDVNEIEIYDTHIF